MSKMKIIVDGILKKTEVEFVLKYRIFVIYLWASDL